MVYSIFRFFDELALLKIRLEVLSGTVDKFILIEANHTVAGTQKPLYYAENASMFKDYNIESIVVRRLPVSTRFETVESYNWNAAIPALIDIAADDTVVVSDLDEIPSPDAIRSYSPAHGIVGLQMTHYFYWLNFRLIDQSRLRNYTMKICSGSDLQHRTLHGVRWFDSKTYGKTIAGAGWHFSYAGGADSVLRKLQANESTPRPRDPVALERIMNSGLDIINPEYGVQLAVAGLAEMPAYVQINDSELRMKGMLK